DMPAGRKVIGFNPPKSNYSCPFCQCHTRQFSDPDVLEGKYALRNREEWLRQAHMWNNTPSEQQRKQLKSLSGVGWSELFRLPYWDPTKHFVVDGMHNLFLGLIQNHVRKVWGVQEASKKIKDPGRSKRTSRAHTSAAAAVRGSSDDVRRGNRPCYLVLDSDGCPVSESRASRDVTDNLAAEPPAQVSQPPGPTLVTPPLASHTLSSEELRLLRVIIKQTSTPAWLGRMTKTFGSSSQGTLKADEWRTIATVHLPIALTRLWSGTERQEDLEWFLDLVAAVQIATKRTMSVNRATEFKERMMRYIKGLTQRGYHLLPNHHAAMHFGDFLPLFGPLRGWWAYPIERQIGLLQKIKTNNQ
ncbi:hypothetical protein AURDEDRAFT_49460, partial [Auricularia subglabra TFB-10046 SS5]